MSDFRKMTPEQLTVFLGTAATAVANGKVTGFLAAQNTAISDGLIAINATLAADILNYVQTEEAFNQAREQRAATLATALDMVSDLKMGMHSVRAPASEFAIVGFDAPDNTRSAVVPQTPTKLSAIGFSNGINVLRWTSHNRSGSVYFQIECKIGTSTDYVQVGATRSSSFRHVDVTPGLEYRYHVRAIAARGANSEWSNEAVVYGV